MSLNKVNYITHEPSYFDTTVHSKLRRIALSQHGEVVGIHHPNNTNLWEDGTQVDWTSYENNGWNCMVQIPKFYYKVEFGTLGSFQDVYRAEVAEKETPGYKLHPAFEREEGIIENYQYMSSFEGWVDGFGKLRSLPHKNVTVSRTRHAFRQAAELNGSDYRQQEFYLTSAIQMLFITEYGGVNSQNLLGLGRSTGTASYLKTGESLENGNHSYGDKVNNTKHMSYRGIENFYSNYWKALDGLNIQNRIPYASKKNFADDVFTGNYQRIGTGAVPSYSGAYITNFHKNQGEFDFTFIPSTVGGNQNTYFGDGLWTSTGNRVAFFGGDSSAGSLCGSFCLALNNVASAAYANIGARLSYLSS